MSNSDGNLRPWRQIAQELAEEKNPDKVTVLARELTEALDAQGPHFDLRVAKELSRPAGKRRDAL